MIRPRLLSCLRGDTRGAALTEFTICMPVILLFLAVAIDGARLAWSYQAVAAGVRDAARMVARTTSPDFCVAGDIETLRQTVTDIVTGAVSGSAPVPGRTRVLGVTPSVAVCQPTVFRGGAMVVEVRADIEFDYILGGVFGLFGDERGTLQASIADQSRVYGL